MSDAQAQWKAAIQAEVKGAGGNKLVAMVRARRKNPELFDAAHKARQTSNAQNAADANQGALDAK